MQVVSSGYAGVQAAPFKRVNHGVLISFLRTTISGIKFFQIGQSKIGGSDIIPGGGTAVSFFDKYQLTDYTRYVKSWSVDRRFGQYPYGVILAQADLELINTSSLFTPDFDAVIGSGTGQPNRPLKISAGIGLDSLKQFTGYTGQPETTLSSRTTTIHAFDMLNPLSNIVSTTSGVYTDKYFHEILAAEFAAQGINSTQYVLDKSLQQKIGYFATNGQKLGDIMFAGCQAEQGTIFTDENGIIRFWNRQHMTTISGTNLPLNFTFSNMQDVTWENTPIINDVIVKAKPRTVQAKQLIWQLPVATEIIPGETKEFVCDFTDDYGSMPATSVDIPSSGGSTSSWTANTQSDGSGSNGSGYLTLTYAYLQGTSYVVRFKNSYSSSVYLTGLNLYGTPAKVTSVIEERYQDAPSIDAQGRNPSNNAEPLVIENDLIQDKSTAKSLAYTLVNEYKDPRKRLKIPAFPNPATQLGDPANVTFRDSGRTVTGYVVGITTKFSGDANFQQELEIQDRKIKKYFSIGSSKIGSTDSIAP